MSRINATPSSKSVNYNLKLDGTTAQFLGAVSDLFDSHSNTKVSKSILVRKAIRDYTGKLLTSNDPKVIEGELNAIRTVK